VESAERYFQYGVGLAAEMVADPGALCPPSAQAPCILGSGAGLGIRLGYRNRGRWYYGGAYEFSRQDSSNLLRLPILQQLRAETRYYLDRGDRLTPYAAFGVGGVVYGNEWGVEAGGFSAFLGAGVEFEVRRTTLIGAALGYRPLFFRHWTDSAHERRANGALGFGLAHMVVLEVLLELRDPLPRW
jgi:hypothetical protein